MNSPRLAKFPPAAVGRTGWPWTEACATLPDNMPDGSPWPQVSIVTPSYNQGQYIEETIRSVLLQGYPNLEYLILDGGSTDGSVDVIRKYEQWLAYWVSEPDEGQASAVADGWSRSTGSILAYLNSDDTYLPNSIESAVKALSSNEDAVAVCGGELLIDRDGFVISNRIRTSASLQDLMHLRFIPQPAVFMLRSTYQKTGGLDLSYRIAFDYELWTRLAQWGRILCIPSVLATTRWYPETRTLTERELVIEEITRVVNDLLSGIVGSRFSVNERQVIRAKLARLATSVYLDNPEDNYSKIILNSLTAFFYWPPIAWSLIRLFILKLAPKSLVKTASHWKRRVRGSRFSESESGHDRHWSTWETPSKEGSVHA